MEEFDDFNDMFGNDDLMEDPVDNFDNDQAPSDADILNNLFDAQDGKAKRRIVQRPQPKLNENSLVGPKGIPAIRDAFKDFKLNKDADPYSNLNVVMKKYEHWAHLLFPKMKFEDVIARCETLGMRRIVKVYMMKSRLGMPLTDEDFADGDSKREKDGVITTECNEDGQDDNNEPAAKQMEGIITSREEDDEDENYYDPFQDQREEEPDYSDFPDL